MPGRGVALLLVLSLAATALGCASAAARRSEKRSEAQRHLRYGRLMFEQGQTSRAIESIEKAIESDPDLAESYNLLGLIPLQMSEFERARDQFRLALRIDPYYTDAHNHLGIAYRELKQYDRALREFRRALEDRSYQWPEKIHLNVGYLYLERNQVAQAIAAFEQAVTVDPEYLRGILALGMAYRQSGRENLARDKFLRVVELGPDTVEGRKARQLLDGMVQ